jgi:hypothetical protein
MKIPARGSRPKPPRGYTAPARQFWGEGWDLDDAALTILDVSVCRPLMRIDEARAILAREGPTITDRFKQVKVHPAILIERDLTATFLAGLKALNLDLEPLRDRAGRPPGS